MQNEKALILIAHSDWRTLMAIYALLDSEGYFVAPCCSRSDLLDHCLQYRPDLVMTANDLSGEADDDCLLKRIRERSPDTRILLLPDVLAQGSDGTALAYGWTEEILRVAKAMPVPFPAVQLNGF